jgi:hypothetical protein
MGRMNRAEVSVAAAAVARKLKMSALKQVPGMDHVAAILNSTPTSEEVRLIERVFDALDATGYVIVRKEEPK